MSQSPTARISFTRLPQHCVAPCSDMARDLLEFSLALHQKNSEVRRRLQRREAGKRSRNYHKSYHCCSR